MASCAALPDEALRRVCDFLPAHSQLTARLVCTQWADAMASQPQRLWLPVPLPPGSGRSAAQGQRREVLAAQRRATLFVPPQPLSTSPAAAAGSGGGSGGEPPDRCPTCMRMALVAQRLPQLSHLTLRWGFSRQHAAGSEAADDPFACQCARVPEAAASGRAGGASAELPPPPMPRPRRLSAFQGLLFQLQSLEVDDASPQPPRQSSSVLSALCAVAPELSQLTALSLHTTSSALAAIWGDAQSLGDAAQAAMHQQHAAQRGGGSGGSGRHQHVQLLARLPCSLRRLRLLAARKGCDNVGAHTLLPPLLAPLALHHPQLQELQVDLPLALTQADAGAVRLLAAGGRLRSCRLLRVAWLLEASDGAPAPSPGRQQQQQQLQGQDGSAAGGLRELQLGWLVGDIGVVLPPLPHLMQLTLLQLPVSCTASAVGGLSALRQLRSVHFTSQPGRASSRAESTLTGELLQRLVCCWPQLEALGFEGHIRPGAAPRGNGLAAGGGWQLFGSLPRLQRLCLGPPRVAPSGDWADAAALLPVQLLPRGLTSLELHNMPLDDYEAPLPCSASLQQLRLHWPWRVNEQRKWCRAPCLLGCGQLARLQLVGVELLPGTLTGLAAQCPQLADLELNYCRCRQAADAGLGRMFEGGGAADEEATERCARAPQLATLRLACDTSRQLLGLMRVLPSVVSRPPASSAAVVAPAPAAGGSVRVLDLSCKDLTAADAKQVVSTVAASCAGLSRLALTLRGPGGAVPRSWHSGGGGGGGAVAQLQRALLNTQLDVDVLV